MRGRPAPAPGGGCHGFPHRWSSGRGGTCPSRVMPAAGRRMVSVPHLRLGKWPLAGSVRGRPWKADGYTDRAIGTDAVRYTSVDTARYRLTVTHGDTRRDKKETARLAENSQLAGRFRRWWQVLGSNQRRLSRRFYTPSLLAELPPADQRLCASRHDLGLPPSAMRPWVPGSGGRAGRGRSRTGPRTGADRPTDGGRERPRTGPAGAVVLAVPVRIPALTCHFRRPARYRRPRHRARARCPGRRGRRRCAGWRRWPGRRCSGRRS